MRVLAVDFGEKRCGLAVSDESGSVVVPVGAFLRKSDDQAARAITHAAQEREVTRIVVGYPLNLDGTEGPYALRVRSFARKLADACGLPVELHGEGLTSEAAERNLIEAGVCARRRGVARDAEAAAVILRDYFFEHGPGDAAR